MLARGDSAEARRETGATSAQDLDGNGVPGCPVGGRHFHTHPALCQWRASENSRLASICKSCFLTATGATSPLPTRPMTTTAPSCTSAITSEAFQRLMAEHGVTCSMSRSGNVWDNAAMESFFSSLKVERVARKIYRTRDQARADVFDYIERFYNPRRRHSTIGYVSPMEFEQRVLLA